MNNLSGRVWPLIAQMPPAYFALVMSTGIVSGITHLLFLRSLAHYFFYVAVALWFLTFLGLCRSLWQSIGPSHPAG